MAPTMFAKDEVKPIVMGALLYLRSPYFIGTAFAHIIALIVMLAKHVNIQWFWLLLYSAVCVPFSPYLLDPVKFFRGGLSEEPKSASSFTMLSMSSFVAWVFAKSIYNSATLGASFGIMGGLAYASYYTSFLSVGLCIYFMRTRQGYKSLPEAINQRYGPLATVAFGAIVLYRLYQEVWSNAVVVAGFYGDTHSGHWWAAAIVSTLIPAFYASTGGMRSALVTDMWQAIWKIAFLIAILALVGSNNLEPFATFNSAGTCQLPPSTSINSSQQCAALAGNALDPTSSTLLEPVKATFSYTAPSCSYPAISNQTFCSLVGGSWSAPQCAITTEPSCDHASGSWQPRDRYSLAGGLDFLAVGFLQGCLSYPFFDPVLTDRAFLAEPHTMLAAFTFGGALAAAFIILFSLLGIFGNMQAVLAPSTVPAEIFADVVHGVPQGVAKYFGTAWFSIINLVFIVSSCAVLDSTFTSAAKLFGPEVLGLIEAGRPSPPDAAQKRHLWLGRVMIVVIAAAGLCQLIVDPTVLNATTVSGTMVVGLGPPVWALTFIKGYRPLLFHLPFWTGIAIAIVYQLSTSACCKDNVTMTGWFMGGGSYKDLLGINVIAVVCCWGLAALTLMENLLGLDLPSQEARSLVGAMKAVVNYARHLGGAIGRDAADLSDEDTKREVSKLPPSAVSVAAVAEGSSFPHSNEVALTVM